MQLFMSRWVPNIYNWWRGGRCNKQGLSGSWHHKTNLTSKLLKRKALQQGYMEVLAKTLRDLGITRLTLQVSCWRGRHCNKEGLANHHRDLSITGLTLQLSCWRGRHCNQEWFAKNLRDLGITGLTIHVSCWRRRHCNKKGRDKTLRYLGSHHRTNLASELLKRKELQRNAYS